MFKKIDALYVFVVALIAIIMVLVVGSVTASAQPLFGGIRPSTADVLDKPLTVSIPVLPSMGLSNLKAFGDIPPVVKTMYDINTPDTLNVYIQAESLMDSINALKDKRITTRAFVLPTRLLSVNSKYFELTLDGGVLNSTYVNANGLDEKLSYGNMWFDSDFSPHFFIDKQAVFTFNSITAFGGDLWAVGKYPIKVGKYTITPLAGVGMTLGYMHKYRSSVVVSSETAMGTGGEGFVSPDAKPVTLVSILSDNYHEEQTEMGLVFGLHGMVGVQLDGFKWLRPRFVLQVCGPTVPKVLSNKLQLAKGVPEVNMGLSVDIWKIVTLKAKVTNVGKPQYAVELSRSFLTNNEVAVGYLSSFYGSKTGYLMLGLGGEIVKFNATVLTDGKHVGLLVGFNLGWHPSSH